MLPPGQASTSVSPEDVQDCADEDLGFDDQTTTQQLAFHLALLEMQPAAEDSPEEATVAWRKLLGGTEAKVQKVPNLAGKTRKPLGTKPVGSKKAAFGKAYCLTQGLQPCHWHLQQFILAGR